MIPHEARLNAVSAPVTWTSFAAVSAAGTMWSEAPPEKTSKSCARSGDAGAVGRLTYAIAVSDPRLRATRSRRCHSRTMQKAGIVSMLPLS